MSKRLNVDLAEVSRSCKKQQAFKIGSSESVEESSRPTVGLDGELLNGGLSLTSARLLDVVLSAGLSGLP